MENAEIKATIPEEPQLSPEELAFANEMIEAGVWHGRKHSKLNPKMANYIIGNRRGVDVIDLLKTRKLLDEAAEFLKGIKEKKLPVLVVGTRPATADLAKEFAEKFSWAYVIERWLGGTLTNFKVITKRIEYFKKLRSDKESGKLSKYTKKEQLMASRELDKLSRNFIGIENMVDLPAVVVVVNVASHPTVIREANKMKIPVVGLINTDGDPEKINYLIPVNDNARPSVKWTLEELAKKVGEVKPAVDENSETSSG